MPIFPRVNNLLTTKCWRVRVTVCLTITLITSTRPGQAPIVRTKRSTVCGSIACGLSTSPSSMPASTSSSDVSIT